MVSPRFKTIIFDLDGTLVDSLADIADAANAALNLQGMPEHPRDNYRHYVGDGLMTLTERMVPAGTAKSHIVETAELFKVNYQDNWAQSSGPYPGIVAMIDTLVKNKLNIGVLSNKPDNFTQLFVTKFFPGNLFGRVIGNRQDLPKKPDPKGALVIADHFGSEPAFCLLVGDTAVDIKTAQSAGMTSMGVTWGFRGRQELEDSGADIIIDSPSDILSHVLHDC